MGALQTLRSCTASQSPDKNALSIGVQNRKYLPPKTRPPIHTDIFRFRMDRAFFFLFERRMNKSFAKKKKKNGQIDSE
jgi:hypothetical protein